MSVLDERDAYKSNPYFSRPEYGDFTPFYITVTICTIIGISIFILNIVLGCCSRYSDYWNDRHTGTSPLRQSECASGCLGLCTFNQYCASGNVHRRGNRWIVSLWTATPHQQSPLDFTELEEINIPKQVVYVPVEAEKVEYRELQKRESDI